jgi:hypothetical protein
MRTFTDLFNQQSRLQLRYPATGAKLSELLSHSSLGLWQLGDGVPGVPSRVLVGVATWSGYDMRLLDELNETCMRRPNPNERIEIFDTNDVRQEQLDEYVPGIGKVVGLPVVGIWENGILIQKESGAVALNLLIDRYSLDRKRIMKLP